MNPRVFMTALAGLLAASLSAPFAFAQTQSAPPSPPDPNAAEPAPLQPAEATLWIIAPHPREPWTIRIDNIGSKPIRVPADARLLKFTADLPEFGPAPIEPEDDPASKKPKAKKPKPKPKKPIVCEAPAGLKPQGFPEDRALLLAPGESYIDTFDPYLLCFAKNAAALSGAVTLKPQLGFPPPKAKPAFGKKKAKPEAPKGPFAVEGTDFPATVAPVYELFAPTMVLSYGLAPAPAEKAPNKTDETAAETAERPPIVDQNAPRLEISGSEFVDAAAERNASMTVIAKNAGHRPMLAVLRPRMLSFRIDKPDGTGAVCGPDASPRGMPRDSYKNHKPGETVSFSVLLGEVCPRGTFARPGIYKILPTLHAEQTGAEHGIMAYTAVVDAPKPTILRIKEGTLPFHREAPRAVATPKPAIETEEAK